MPDPGAIPVQFGPYRIQDPLGEGSFAKVYRAEFQGPWNFRKEVALKVVHHRISAANERFFRSLVNEARLGGLLKHPNIIEVYECGQVGDRCYIAMEYVDGISLREVLGRQGALPRGAVLEVGIQACRGLHHAHEVTQGGAHLELVHRDVKPDNFMISRHDLVKIMDFGIAKARLNAYQTAPGGMTRGTPLYMSPEQIAGKELTRRSDLFALGAVLGELACGRPIFEDDNLMAILNRALRCDVGPGLARVGATFPDLVPVLKRCMAADPYDRYPSAETLAADLAGLKARNPWAGRLSSLVPSAQARTVQVDLLEPPARDDLRPSSRTKAFFSTLPHLGEELADLEEEELEVLPASTATMEEVALRAAAAAAVADAAEARAAHAARERTVPALGPVRGPEAANVPRGGVRGPEAAHAPRGGIATVAHPVAVGDSESYPEVTLDPVMPPPAFVPGPDDDELLPDPPAPPPRAPSRVSEPEDAEPPRHADADSADLDVEPPRQVDEDDPDADDEPPLRADSEGAEAEPDPPAAEPPRVLPPVPAPPPPGASVLPASASPASPGQGPAGVPLAAPDPAPRATPAAAAAAAALPAPPAAARVEPPPPPPVPGAAAPPAPVGEMPPTGDLPAKAPFPPPPPLYPPASPPRSRVVRAADPPRAPAFPAPPAPRPRDGAPHPPRPVPPPGSFVEWNPYEAAPRPRKSELGDRVALWFVGVLALGVLVTFLTLTWLTRPETVPAAGSPLPSTAESPASAPPPKASFGPEIQVDGEGQRWGHLPVVAAPRAGAVLLTVKVYEGGGARGRLFARPKGAPAWASLDLMPGEAGALLAALPLAGWVPSDVTEVEYRIEVTTAAGDARGSFGDEVRPLRFRVF